MPYNFALELASFLSEGALLAIKGSARTRLAVLLLDNRVVDQTFFFFLLRLCARARKIGLFSTTLSIRAIRAKNTWSCSPNLHSPANHSGKYHHHLTKNILRNYSKLIRESSATHGFTIPPTSYSIALTRC